MPQNPNAVTIGVSGGKQVQPAVSGGQGGALAVVVNGGTGIATSTALNVTSNTVLKASAGILRGVNVVSAGSGATAGKIFDAATVSGAATSNQIATMGTTVVNGGFVGPWPFSNGLVVEPGTSTTLAVSYT